LNELADWKPCERPQQIILEGHYCRLEPLSAERHGNELFNAATLEDADGRFRWLPESSPSSRAEFENWLSNAEASADPIFFAVIDKRSNTVEGRQTLMRIDEANGVIETGHIFWGGNISRTPVTTEAFFLFAHYVFDTLGYRRFEWKCNNRNEPSKSAALRFGMSPEGVFRQAAVIKGENRDTAWFSLLDHEWPVMRRAFERWLDPSNFDENGQQRKRLQELKDLT